MWHIKNILFFSFWEVSFFKLQMPFLDPPLSMKKGLNKNSCIFMFFLIFSEGLLTILWHWLINKNQTLKLLCVNLLINSAVILIL